MYVCDVMCVLCVYVYLHIYVCAVCICMCNMCECVCLCGYGMCMFMCVCAVYLCVCRCGICTCCMHTWLCWYIHLCHMPRGYGRTLGVLLCQSLTYSLETGLFTELGAGLGPESTGEPPVSVHTEPGFQCVWRCSAFHMEARMWTQALERWLLLRHLFSLNCFL